MQPQILPILPILCLLLLLIPPTTSLFTYDLLPQRSTTFYTCYKSSNHSSIILNLQVSSTEPSKLDTQSLQNLKNALNSGLKIQVVFAPCRGYNGLGYVRELVKEIGSGNIDKIWIKPFDTYPKQCYWGSYDGTSNCNYLQQFNKILQQNNFKTGVHTARVNWMDSFDGNQLGCPEIGTVPLYWEPAYEEYDGGKNFKNYKQIGGWKVPYSKIYGNTNICGTIFDMIYYE